MKNLVRLTLLSACTAGLMACGGGAKLDKEGAAQAVFQAGQAAGSSGTSANSLVERMVSAADLNVEIKVSCRESGQVALKLTGAPIMGTDGRTITKAFDTTYADCNQDGKNTLDGTMRMKMVFAIDTSGTGGVSGSMALTFKGKLTIEGEISDFVEADVTQTMDFAALSERTGSVTVSVNGTITTSSGQHTYNSETVVLTPGALPRT